MAFAVSPKRSSDSAGFVPILVANVIPLVGIVAFGWDPVTLVAIYAVEVVLSILLAGAKALFAQRRPSADRNGVLNVSNAELAEKRGSVEPVASLPPMYPRNVPFAVAVIGGVAWISIFLVVAFEEILDVAVFARSEVLLGAGSLVLGQFVETYRSYVRDRKYEDVSPYSVIETPARQAFFLTFALFVVAGGSGAAFGGRAVLGVVVLVKLLIDWSAYRATRDDGGGRLTGWLAGPDEPAGERESIRVPAGEPNARFPAHRRSVLYTAVLRTLFPTAPIYATWFTMVWLVTVAFTLGSDAATATLLASVGVFLGLFVCSLGIKIAGYYARYAPLEYRRYDDRIVGYDAWLSEPQWSASVEVLRDVTVVADRLPDRLFDTRTFELTTGWGDGETDRCVGPVSTPEAFVEAFDLPVATTELQPLDRRIAAVAVALAAATLVVPVVLIVGPWLPFDSVLNVIFLAPFALVVPYGIWRQVY